MPTSYHVQGFKRDDHGIRVSVIIDADDAGEVFKLAEAVVGPNYCFHASGNINHSVPAAAKNRLFGSDQELFAAVPEMSPRWQRAQWRAQRAKRKS